MDSKQLYIYLSGALQCGAVIPIVDSQTKGLRGPALCVQCAKVNGTNPVYIFDLLTVWPSSP